MANEYYMDEATVKKYFTDNKEFMNNEGFNPCSICGVPPKTVTYTFSVEPEFKPEDKDWFVACHTCEEKHISGPKTHEAAKILWNEHNPCTSA